jgi:hypothetical protein
LSHPVAAFLLVPSTRQGRLRAALALKRWRNHDHQDRLREFAPQKNAHSALHVDDVAAARAELEAKVVEFNGETFDAGVCHVAFFTDPDGTT